MERSIGTPPGGPAAAGERRSALLLAEGFRLQYRVLRCAAAALDGIVVLGTPAARPLRLSRLCGRFEPLGHDRFEPDDLGRINDICERLNIGIVIPTCGETSRFVARHRAELAVPAYDTPTAETFDRLNDKWRFSQLCAELAVPQPGTALFENAAAIASALREGRLTPPFMVKPLGMWGSYGVARIDTAEDLRRLPVAYEPILVQDFVEGRDLIAFFCCREGRVLDTIVYAKTAGELRFLERNILVTHARRIVAHLACDGVVGFDVREAPDGALSFIECNPRFWYNIDLAMVAGRNFVALGLGQGTRAAGPRLPASVSRPWSLLRKCARPWSLTGSDMALLHHVLRDPLPLGWMALQRLTGGYGQAVGRQF